MARGRTGRLQSDKSDWQRLDRLEAEVQKKADPGYGPVLIDDYRDPENVKRLEKARQFKRDNPNGLIIHRVIVRPPNGESNWEHISREKRERCLAASGRDFYRKA